MLFQSDALLFLQVKAFIVVVYLLISCMHLLLILKLYTLQFMTLILIILHFMSLFLNVFLIPGLHKDTSLIQKPYFISLQAIVIIKGTSVFIHLAKKFSLTIWFLMSYFSLVKVLEIKTLLLLHNMSLAYLIHGYLILTLILLYKLNGQYLHHYV